MTSSANNIVIIEPLQQETTGAEKVTEPSQKEANNAETPATVTEPSQKETTAGTTGVEKVTEQKENSKL